MSATRMLFRTVKHGPFRGDVDAVIVDAEVNPGRLCFYSHIGQHGEGCRAFLAETREATREERLPLVRELQRIYGPIRILRRLPARR